MIISAGCLLMRGVSRISPFNSKLRLLLGIIYQTFIDIGAFLFLFAYMISAMAIMHVVASRGDDDYKKNMDHVGFSHSLRKTYQ